MLLAIYYMLGILNKLLLVLFSLYIVHRRNAIRDFRRNTRRKERSAHNALRPTRLSPIVAHVISHLDLNAMNIV